MEFSIKSIGVIRTPFKSSDKIPIQSSDSEMRGYVEISSEYQDGFKSLDEGDSVEFDVVSGPKGFQAQNVAKL